MRQTGPPSVVDRCAQWKAKRERRLHEERNRKEQDNFEECTFRPQTTPFERRRSASPRLLNPGSPMAPPPPYYTAVGNGYPGLTYSPPGEWEPQEWNDTQGSILYDTPGGALAAGQALGSPHRSSVYAPSTTAEMAFWGVEQHVERLERARIQKEQREQAFAHLGKNWRNRVTKPKAPQLGRHRAEVKALEKPLSPPRYRADESPLAAARAAVEVAPTTDGTLPARDYLGELGALGEVPLPARGLFSNPSSHAILGAAAGGPGSDRTGSEVEAFDDDDDNWIPGAPPALAARSSGAAPRRPVSSRATDDDDEDFEFPPPQQAAVANAIRRQAAAGGSDSASLSLWSDDDDEEAPSLTGSDDSFGSDVDEEWLRRRALKHEEESRRGGAYQQPQAAQHRSSTAGFARATQPVGHAAQRW